MELCILKVSCNPHVINYIGNYGRGDEMKIFTQLKADELEGALSNADAAKRRWTESSADLPVGGQFATATVAEGQVDLIRTRQAREDGGWSKEVCLFPGAQLSDFSIASV